MEQFSNEEHDEKLLCELIPKETIFEISDAASKQILTSSESSGSKDWPLRVAVNIDDNGKFNYLMGFDQSKEEDLRLKINKVEIIIAPVLLAIASSRELRFIVIHISGG